MSGRQVARAKVNIPAADEAFRRACDMEKPIVGIRNFTSILAMIAETMDQDHGVVVQELAWTIRDQLAEVEKIHGFFFRLHHPNREQFEREGWPSPKT